MTTTKRDNLNTKLDNLHHIVRVVVLALKENIEHVEGYKLPFQSMIATQVLLLEYDEEMGEIYRENELIIDSDPLMDKKATQIKRMLDLSIDTVSQLISIERVMVDATEKLQKVVETK